MKTESVTSIILLLALSLGAVAQAQTQQPASISSPRHSSAETVSSANSSILLARLWRGRRPGFSLMTSGNQSRVTTVAAASSNSAVHGNGTVGNISMWDGTRPNGDSTLGDSIITQSGGNIGIGVASPGSKLTVQGMIETTLGGVKFPDGTVQTSAGGGGTVTGISANAPLFVNNPTTTPVISLGIVPAAHGGTGMSSPGAAGQFLRSDGGAWMSTALFAPDIPGGSAFYIQNSTGQQPATNFNIDGIGTANIFNASVQFALEGQRILSSGGRNNLFVGFFAGDANSGLDNTFVGALTGTNNTTGGGNSFFGVGAGFRNTVGRDNNFFGQRSGENNTSGNQNSFFGTDSGATNMTGNRNSFFGSFAGFRSTTGSFNAFFGRGAGFNNQTADSNSFFGTDAGFNNTTGNFNAFFGQSTGSANTSGMGNTFVGTFANFNASGATGDFNTLLGAAAIVSAGVNNATAIGAGASVFTSHTIVLGTANETVRIPGSLNVTGVKNFRIDHPLDPENKYLYHAAIESSEVLNIYSGNVVTDAKGEAVVALPDWFEALNRDLRYQLTVIGAFAQAVVAEKVKHNRFTIRSSAPKVEVSWQVTGVRSDRVMREHPFKAEEEKPAQERGHTRSSNDR